jgi:hypothetical protein
MDLDVDLELCVVHRVNICFQSFSFLMYLRFREMEVCINYYLSHSGP